MEALWQLFEWTVFHLPILDSDYKVLSRMTREVSDVEKHSLKQTMTMTQFHIIDVCHPRPDSDLDV